jgi:iron complex outermembrane receptor protein
LEEAAAYDPGRGLGPDRNFNCLGVRGLNRTGDFSGRTLVLVDGHRINENIYDGPLLENGFIPGVDLIDRVEVIRGPSSSLYGISAFFGVITTIYKARARLSLGCGVLRRRELRHI